MAVDVIGSQYVEHFVLGSELAPLERARAAVVAWRLAGEPRLSLKGDDGLVSLMGALLDPVVLLTLEELAEEAQDAFDTAAGEDGS